MLKIVILSAQAGNLITCVKALLAQQPDVAPADIIVVDDGARALAEPALPSGIVWVAGQKPFIFARNANLGVAAAGSADVLLLNDDANLDTPNGLTALADDAQGAGLCSASIRGDVGNPAQQAGSGAAASDHLAFVAIHLPRATLSRVGPLDERFDGYGYEDDDYCRRVRAAGLDLRISPRCVFEHGHTPSTYRTHPMTSIAMLSSWGKLLAKYPPVLSVLICSLECRKDSLELLLFNLRRQQAALPHPEMVEFLVDTDAGQAKVGAKRNRLLARARGAYAGFIDDDDQVETTYLADILAAIGSYPSVDCVTFWAFMTVDGKPYRPVDYSITNPPVGQRDMIFLRSPNHLCPVRTTLARRAGFPEDNFGEDTAYANRLRPLLRTEAKVRKTLYFYQFSHAGTATQQPNR